MHALPSTAQPQVPWQPPSARARPPASMTLMWPACSSPLWSHPATCTVGGLLNGLALLCHRWAGRTIPVLACELGAAAEPLPRSLPRSLLQLAGKTQRPLLARPAPSTYSAAVVRDLPDLQRVSLLFAQRLLCLQPSPLHASAARNLSREVAEGDGTFPPPSPADVSVEVCSALFRGRHTAQLAALQLLLPASSQDMRLLFFKVGKCDVAPAAGGCWVPCGAEG